MSPRRSRASVVLLYNPASFLSPMVRCQISDELNETALSMSLQGQGLSSHQIHVITGPPRPIWAFVRARWAPSASRRWLPLTQPLAQPPASLCASFRASTSPIGVPSSTCPCQIAGDEGEEIRYLVGIGKGDLYVWVNLIIATRSFVPSQASQASLLPSRRQQRSQFIIQQDYSKYRSLPTSAYPK